MTKFKLLPALGRTFFTAALLGGLAFSVSAEPPAGSSSSTNAAAVAAGSAGPGPATVKQHLTGAELYSIHCNRCHAERYPTERTAANWKTIMLHMQVRANIPGQQARLILQYLQENSGR
jgi:hypothetical protein